MSRPLRSGDDVIVHTTRADLLERYDEDYTGKTGRILAVQQGTGHFLLKFKGKAFPVSFPPEFVGVHLNEASQ